MLHFDIDSNQYQNTLPFPYAKFDGALNEDMAKQIQAEILSIDEVAWDRYDNPFEQKYTLRDKYNFPPLLTHLFTYLESHEFVEKLSKVCGYKLYCDETRNFWGVHKYKAGDRLDIHADAGIHPTMKKKKQLTLGLYLSSEWDESYGCALEIWKGDSAGLSEAKLHEKVDAIVPLFNRLVLFTCNDYAWHGNPEPAACPSEAKRIFLTMSYMSDNMDDTNKRMKALFIARPQDPSNPEKDKLRLLRADPEKYKDIYRIPSTIPKIAFSFWEGNQFTYLHYLTIVSFSKYNPDFKIIIYTTNTINNVLVFWNTGEQSKRYENLYDINKLKDIPNVSFHYIDINHELQYSGVLSSVWKSDIIRIMKLYEHGGIYIDFDTLFIKKIDERLLNIDKDIAFNTYYGVINNAFIVSKPRNNTIKYILDNISNKLKAGDVSLTYMQFGPTLITQLIKNTSYKSNIYYIPNEMTCPYLCDQMNLLFNSNVNLIKEDTFCIHWYNGDTHSRNYCSTFDINNIKKDDCIFNKLLIDLLSN